jgi:hypothetical protein
MSLTGSHFEGLWRAMDMSRLTAFGASAAALRGAGSLYFSVYYRTARAATD